MEEKPKNANSTAAMERAARVKFGERPAASWLSGAVAAIGGTVAAWTLVSVIGDRGLNLEAWKGAELRARAAHQAQQEAQAQAARQAQEILEVKNRLDAVINSSARLDASPSSAEVALLRKRLDAIEAEQKRMTDVLADTPEKAMAVPMMRRDIDDMKVNQAQAADTSKREIDRLYDLIKSTIFALAAGVFGLLGVQYFERRHRAKE